MKTFKTLQQHSFYTRFANIITVYREDGELTRAYMTPHGACNPYSIGYSQGIPAEWVENSAIDLLETARNQALYKLGAKIDADHFTRVELVDPIFRDGYYHSFPIMARYQDKDKCAIVMHPSIYNKWACELQPMGYKPKQHDVFPDRDATWRGIAVYRLATVSPDVSALYMQRSTYLVNPRVSVNVEYDTNHDSYNVQAKFQALTLVTGGYDDTP